MALTADSQRARCSGSQAAALNTVSAVVLSPPTVLGSHRCFGGTYDTSETATQRRRRASKRQEDVAKAQTSWRVQGRSVGHRRIPSSPTDRCFRACCRVFQILSTFFFFNDRKMTLNLILSIISSVVNIINFDLISMTNHPCLQLTTATPQPSVPLQVPKCHSSESWKAINQVSKVNVTAGSSGS